MPKVQPPELKKFMDKKLSSESTRRFLHRARCMDSGVLSWGTAILRSYRHHTPHAVTLNANRQVTGVLRGFDQFMNLVLDATVDEKMKTDIGMVVSASIFGGMHVAEACMCLGENIIEVTHCIVRARL